MIVSSAIMYAGNCKKSSSSEEGDGKRRDGKILKGNEYHRASPEMEGSKEVLMSMHSHRRGKSQDWTLSAFCLSNLKPRS